MGPGGYDGDAKMACEGGELRQRIREANTGSGEQYRTLSVANTLERVGNLLGNLLRWKDEVVLRSVIVTQVIGINLGGLNIDRDIEPARTWATGLG